jgi:hypothetical protein
MRKSGLHQRVLGVLLGMQVLCYLPAYSGGAFANPRGPAGGSVDRLPAMAQIQGTIVDNNGNPISGVTVQVKGTKRGATTDAGGRFSIEAARGETLVISIIGFQTKEVKVGEETTLSLSLAPFSAQMTEVVVTALGIKKQSRVLGYSTTEVAGSEISGAREINIGNALTGQVAGVSVAGDATGPYGSSRITIRGNASLTGNNQPLYVIDGIPFDNTNQGSAGEWGGADLGDGLSNINPDDIESKEQRYRRRSQRQRDAQ